MAELAGKVCVVTGGARGIGGAAAVALAAAGARVAIGDVLAAEGEQTVERIRTAGGDAFFVRTDVTRDGDCVRLMEEAVRRYGRLDVLVAAAGILEGALVPIEEFSEEVFDRVIAVNLKGIFLTVKRAVPYIRRSGGGVVLLIASGAGVRGPSSSLAYGASKGGVNGLGMTLEPRLARDGIRLHVVCPGSINTQLKRDNVADVARQQGQSPEEALAAADARGQLGDPATLAQLLVFLATDRAAYLRGNVFTR